MLLIAVEAVLSFALVFERLITSRTLHFSRFGNRRLLASGALVRREAPVAQAAAGETRVMANTVSTIDGQRWGTTRRVGAIFYFAAVPMTGMLVRGAVWAL